MREDGEEGRDRIDPALLDLAALACVRRRALGV